MCNLDIRNKAKAAGVRLWRIAERLGYTDATFSRKLRIEFSPEMKAEIFMLIEALASEAE